MPPKALSEFVIQQRFDKHGWKLIKYKNCMSPIECVCPNGHKHHRLMGTFNKHGYNCRLCKCEEIKKEILNNPKDNNQFIAKRTNVDPRTVISIRRQIQTTGDANTCDKLIATDGKLRSIAKPIDVSKYDISPSVKILHNVVYFILSTEGKPRCKIGFATYLYNRLAAISTMSPVGLHVIATMSGTRKTEKIIHKQFEHINDHGEWFWWCEELEEFVKSCTKT